MKLFSVVAVAFSIIGSVDVVSGRGLTKDPLNRYGDCYVGKAFNKNSVFARRPKHIFCKAPRFQQYPESQQYGYCSTTCTSTSFNCIPCTPVQPVMVQRPQYLYQTPVAQPVHQIIPQSKTCVCITAECFNCPPRIGHMPTQTYHMAQQTPHYTHQAYHMEQPTNNYNMYQQGYGMATQGY